MNSPALTSACPAGVNLPTKFVLKVLIALFNPPLETCRIFSVGLSDARSGRIDQIADCAVTGEISGKNARRLILPTHIERKIRRCSGRGNHR